MHYLVRETHLSAYITIRKKLIKPSNEPKILNIVKSRNENNENIEHEIINVKQKNKELR